LVSLHVDNRTPSHSGRSCSGQSPYSHEAVYDAPPALVGKPDDCKTTVTSNFAILSLSNASDIAHSTDKGQTHKIKKPHDPFVLADTALSPQAQSQDQASGNDRLGFDPLPSHRPSLIGETSVKAQRRHPVSLICGVNIKAGCTGT